MSKDRDDDWREPLEGLPDEPHEPDERGARGDLEGGPPHDEPFEGGPPPSEPGAPGAPGAPEEPEPPEALETPATARGFAIRFAQAVLVLALLAALLGAAAGFGSRWGFWHFRTGFSLLRWAAYGAIAVAVLSAFALYLNRPGRHRPGGMRRGFLPAVAALVLSLVVLWIPLQHRMTGRDVPPIHDITTDTENPPEFVAVAPLRAGASNPIEYAGEEVARLQRAAYPDIRPLILDISTERAFERAVNAVQAQGWEIVDQDPARLRIEATARTFWFGFRDDVVIRLTPIGGRTVVDVRSKSRVGRSDLGANARRIRAFLSAMEA